MRTKKKVHLNPIFFQPIFNYFGSDEIYEVEGHKMTNREFYFFLVFAAVAMFSMSYLIKIFII
jgi:hypothetical protein